MPYGGHTNCEYWAGGPDPFYTTTRKTEAIAIADVLVDLINSDASAANKSHGSNIIAGAILKHWKQEEILKGTASDSGHAGRSAHARASDYHFLIPGLAVLILTGTDVFSSAFVRYKPNSDGTW